MTITLRAARSSDQTIIRRMVFDNNLNPFDLAWRNFVVATDVKDCVIGCGQIKTHGELQELASLVLQRVIRGRASRIC